MSKRASACADARLLTPPSADCFLPHMIGRPVLKYHPGGHPVLSKAQIEKYALHFLEMHFPQHIGTPGKLSILTLLHLAESEDGVNSEVCDLGHDSLRKRLGRIYPRQKLIQLDECLYADRSISLPFVATHEFAHWVLHRDCDIPAIRAQENLPDDDDLTEEITGDDFTWTSLKRIEWQANKLAGALLIPQRAAINAIYAIQTELGIITQKGIIFENLTVEGKIETAKQIESLAATFGVSRTVTKIRLADLSLLQKQPGGVARPEREDRKPQNPFSAGKDFLRNF